MSSDGEGRTRKLNVIQYLGYGAGDAANNLTFSMITSFLLIYYTDVAFIPAAAVGTLFLVVRIWGGLTDLFAGRKVDQTETRWGRFPTSAYRARATFRCAGSGEKQRSGDSVHGMVRIGLLYLS